MPGGRAIQKQKTSDKGAGVQIGVEKMNMKEVNKKMMEEIDRILERAGRPTMLPKPMPNYEHDCSTYPDQIRVSFSDGHTEVYDRRVEQPAPQFVESIRIIRKWKQGYVNQPMRRRRNRT